MNKKFIKQIKSELKKEKKIILKELKRFAKQDTNPSNDFDTIFPNIGDKQDENAIEVTLYGNTLPVEHNLEIRLENINKALKRIKNNQYGKCKACGQQINLARLKIMPESDLCIKCKTSNL